MDGVGFGGDFLGAGFVLISDDDMRAFASEQEGHLAANAAAASDDQNDFAAEFRFGRHALQFGLFERPVFDAECFRTRQGNVVMEARERLRLVGTSGLRIADERRRPIRAHWRPT